MDDLAFVRERIESYADYTNADDRRLSDEQVRAYVGEALSRLDERLHPTGGAAEALARVLLRCQFADQLVVRALDADGTSVAAMAAVRAADRELVTLADRADAIALDDAGTYIASIDAALDGRARAIAANTAAPPAH